MRNIDTWIQTKYETDVRGRWRASRSEVPITSRLVVDIIASAYFEAIASHASGRLADLGCGTVPLYGMYRDKVSEVVCIDWPNSLHRSPHVDLFGDLNAPLELEPESFDTVVATDVIEHLHAPNVLFESIARALNHGGKLILGVPFLYWIHEAPYDFHRYTRFALEKKARDAGLSIISLTAFAGAPEVVSDIATKSLAFRPAFARLMYVLSRGILSLGVVKRLSARTRDVMPMGYVLVARRT